MITSSKTLFSALIILLAFQCKGTVDQITKEWFTAGTAATFSMSDTRPGSSLRVSIPMQPGFYFASHLNYIPPTVFNNSEEFRYEFDIELTIFKIKKISAYTLGGLSFGRWKDFNDNLFVHPREAYNVDESILFGIGTAYHLKRSQFFLDYKHYPQIANSYLSIGWHYKFFPSKQIKEEYYEFLKKRHRKRYDTKSSK